MADVTDDRGQLILVTGLLIAVAMVSLVLLLNTAIYTENLASRGADQSGREAVEYQASVVEGVAGLVEEENHREHGTEAAVRENVTDGIDLIDNYTARSYGIGGTAVRINETSVDTHPGRLVRQTDNDRVFSNESGSVYDWRLADGVENASGFTIDVNDTNLEDTTAGSADGDGAFHVLVEGGTAWELFIYDNTTTGEIEVATTTGGGPVTYRCSTSDARAVIEPMAGTVNGEPCHGLEWAEDVSGDYRIAFRNGDMVNGTYGLTINTSPSGTTINGTNVNPTGSTDSPYQVPAVYSVTFSLDYHSPSLDYRSEVRVAPGESE